MIWKLLRSFSAFRDQEVIALLNKSLIENKEPALIWEAKRSLRLIEKRMGKNGQNAFI